MAETDWGTWLGAFGALIAVPVSVWIAHMQSQEAAKTALDERAEAARRASWSAAIASYQGYLELNVHFPEYAKGIWAGTVPRRDGYGWYLSVLCYAAEQILDAYRLPGPTRAAWRSTLADQLRPHRGALRTELGEALGTFTLEVQNLITDVEEGRV